ncbi:ribose-5-phosphate isomerase RpiA [bacterium]|nr:ribose-5-phosphate isomerase RpiA [bacterium]
MDSKKDTAKWAASRGALEFVKDGMRLGLGTGSTAEKFVILLAQKCKEENWHLICVPTSERTAKQAEELGLILDKDYPDFGHLDLTVDGADEVDPQGNLTKGGGGALLREKFVAMASDKMIVIVDEAKHVHRLGETFKIPIEIVAFAWTNTLKKLSQLAQEVHLRQRDGKTFVTDQGNYIADCVFPGIEDPQKLHALLKSISGVVETGIFANIAKVCVTGKEDGTWECVEF